jgi:hypothetical protein
MNASQILLYALLIVLLYLVYTYMIKGSANKLTAVLPAGTPYVVSEDTIKTLSNGQTIFNYTTSVWVYIDNWDVTPNLKKPILTINNSLDIYLGSIDNNLFIDVYPFAALNQQTGTTSSDAFSLMDAMMGPSEGLTSMDQGHKKKNKDGFQGASFTKVTGKIDPRKPTKEPFSKVSTSATTKKEGFDIAGAQAAMGSNSTINKFTTVVPAIPLQSWTNITVSIHDKSIDVYINGKLIQSNLFPFVPSPVKNAMTLTPAPGFIGWTSNLQYYPYNLTPAQIGNIYNSGYTGSPESLLSLLGKYSMKVVFVDNTQQP